MSKLSVRVPDGVPRAGQPAGWYPDPIGKPVRRLWTGQLWTEWVSDGRSIVSDPLPNRWVPRSGDLGHLEFVERVFLPEVCASGAVTTEQMVRLTGLTHSMADRARLLAVAPGPATRPAAPPSLQGAPPPVVVTRRLPGTWSARTPSAASGPLTPPVPSAIPLAPARPRTPAVVVAGPVLSTVTPTPTPINASPSIVSKWWTRTRESIGSDLAVHGLAYLGVLLFFVGAFGLVVFAFGDVAPNLRPVAEIVIASAPFVAAALLLQRGAVMVGRALEVAGGLVLPVMVITTFLDGFVFPPDLDGPAMVVALTTCCAAIGVGYALWSRRHPASALRFLVAPMAWLSTAMATLGLDRAIPVGKAVATPGAAQTAAIAVCLVITLVLARWRPRAFLAAPTMTAAVPGTLVIGLLALLTWVAEGWPAAQVFTTGALLLVALELLRPRLPGVIDLAEPLWWAVVALALAPGLGVGPAAAVAAVGFVLLVEAAGTRRLSVVAVTVPVVGAFAALLAVWADPRWAAAAYGVASGWALVRRLAPFGVPGADIGLDLAAAVLPAGFVAALGLATELPIAVAVGAGLVLLATAPATRPVLHRNADDRFWTFWWPAAASLVAVAAALGWTTVSVPSERWLLTISVVGLTIATGLGPIPPVWRVWPVLGLGTCAWLMACLTAGLPAVVRGSVLGVAALALVVGAHVRQRSRPVGTTPDPVRAGVGLAGHVVAMLSLAAGGLGWGAVAVTGLATTGWAVTTAFDSRDRSPVGAALARVGEALRYLPTAFVALGIPFTVAMALDAARWLPMEAPWATAVLAAAAVGYGAASRLRVPDRIADTLVWGAFVAGLAASLTSDPGAAVLGLGALILAVLLVPSRRRVALQTWVAWAAVAPMLGLAAEDWLPWFTARPVTETISITLIAVGGTLLIGAGAVDLRFGPWEPRYAPRRAALRPPALLGGLEVVAGLLVTLTTLPTVTAGWLTAVVAAVAFATGMLAAAGLLVGVGAALGWLAALLVIGPDLDSWPLIGLVVVTILLASAGLLNRIVPGGSWWGRWDLPLLVVAAPIALTTLDAAASRGPDPFAVTAVLLGAECWAVAVRLRHRRSVLTALGLVGTGLVLAGAAVAGSGWLALSLIALSLALSVVAARTDGVTHLLFAVGGALVAVTAWLSALVWFSWGAQLAVDVTAVGAGVVVVAASGLAWVRTLDRSWVLIWGGTGVLAATLCMVLAEQGRFLPDQVPAPSPPIAVGLVLVTAALLLAAGPLGFSWLRDLSVTGGIGAAVVVYQASNLPTGAWVTVLVLISIACAVVALAMRDRPNQVLQRPVLELGVGAVVGAIWVAALQLPDVLLLAIGLAAAAVQAAVVGVVLGSIALLALSPILTCSAWLVYASSLTGQLAVDVTAVGAGLITVAASGLAWVRAVDRTWVLIWGATGVVGAAGSAALAVQGRFLPDQVAAPSAPIAIGLALVTVALLFGAGPLTLGWLLDLSVISGLGAATVAFEASDMPAGARVTVLVLTSVAGAVVALALRDRPNRVWQRPVLELGVAAVVGAIWVAALQLPEVLLLVPGLVAAAVQAAAVGIVLGSAVVQALSPILACAAWLVYASELLGGNPQWSTVPIGLAMLCVVALLRHDRSVHDGNMAAPHIIALEFVGIGFLVGASFVQAVTENLVYTLLALTLGLLIAAWGLVTKVRRRLAAGAIIGLAALVLLLAVPLVRLLPELTAAALWVLILGIGLIILVLATLFEKGRNAVRRNAVRFEQTTANWE